MISRLAPGHNRRAGSGAARAASVPDKIARPERHESDLAEQRDDGDVRLPLAVRHCEPL